MTAHASLLDARFSVRRKEDTAEDGKDSEALGDDAQPHHLLRHSTVSRLHLVHAVGQRKDRYAKT